MPNVQVSRARAVHYSHRRSIVDHARSISSIVEKVKEWKSLQEAWARDGGEMCAEVNGCKRHLGTAIVESPRGANSISDHEASDPNWWSHQQEPRRRE